MKLKFDLHVHTEASHDCSTTVEEVIEAAKAKGLDGIAITDHDSVESHGKALKLGKESGLVVIPGIEISTAEGHLIGLNITEKVEPGMSLKDSVQKVKEKGGLAVIPHPFQHFRHGVSKKSLRGVRPDAIEVYNSRLITGFRNRQASKYADKKEFSEVAGSDAHVPGLIGTAVTVVDSESRSVEGVMQSIREGRTELRMKKTPVRMFFRQVLANNWNLRL